MEGGQEWVAFGGGGGGDDGGAAAAPAAPAAPGQVDDAVPLTFDAWLAADNRRAPPAAVNRDVLDLHNQLRSVRVRLEAERAYSDSVDKKVEELTALLQDMEVQQQPHEVANMRQELEAVRTERDAAQGELAGALQRCEELQAEIADLEAAAGQQHEVASLLKALEDKDQRIDGLKSQLAEEMARKEVDRAELAAMRQRVTELEAARTQLAAVLENKREAAEQQLTAVQAAQLASMAAEKERIEREHAALEVARADLAAQRAALLQERQEFEQRTAALLAGTGESEALASKERDCAELESKLADVTQRMEAYRAELAAARQHSTEIEAQRAQLTAAQQQEHEAAEQRVAAVQAAEQLDADDSVWNAAEPEAHDASLGQVQTRPEDFVDGSKDKGKPNVFAISQANGKKKMPPIYASLGELLGLKGPAPKAVYTSLVKVVKQRVVPAFSRMLAGGLDPSDKLLALGNLQAGARTAAGRRFLFGVAQPAATTGDGGASAAAQVGCAFSYEPPQSLKDGRPGDIQMGSAYAYIKGSAAEGACAFAELRQQHLLEDGAEKKGDRLAAGLEAGLVDGDCICWVYCQAVLRDGGKLDWSQVHWRPFSLRE